MAPEIPSEKSRDGVSHSFMIRVEDSARLQDAENNMNKFAHGGADDLHFVFAVASQALTESPDDRVVSFGGERRKEERFSYSGVTGL